MSTFWTAERSLSAARWAKPTFDVPRPPRAEDALEAVQRLREAESEAVARGFAQGQAAGYAEGRALAAGEQQRLLDVLDALAHPLAVADAELERLLVALTLEAARRIAQQELHLDPAKVAAVVRDAVASLGNAPRQVAVYVHPDDYAALVATLAEELRNSEGMGPGWRLVADPEVLPGGCRVESEQASVVASLDARAAGLAHTLLAPA